jgi:hypothetical protein
MFKEEIGTAATYEMLAEECSELAQACLKYARILRGENPTPKTQAEVLNNIIEEYTDVRLVASDLGIIYDNNIVRHKLLRFEGRINERKGHENK